MKEALFTRPDAWSGGEFGIDIFLGNVDSHYAREFLSALWAWRHIQGCWLDKTKEPGDASRLRPTDIDLDDPPRPGSALFGLVELPNGCRCPCASDVMNDDGFWVDFSVPIGSLGRCYPVGAYPFEDGSDPAWVGELSEWFAGMGRGLYGEKPYKAAIIGFLAAALDQDVLAIVSGEVPMKRWHGYLRAESAELKWYPPNADSTPMRADRPAGRSFWSRFLRRQSPKRTKGGHGI
jgi:hypothetical protein